MTATTQNSAGVLERERHFYVWMAAACVAVALLGFAPTFWLRIGSFKAPPIIYIHGLLFSLWTLFFFSQTWLVAHGNVMRHRAMGLAGISLASAMFVVGILAAIRSMAKAEAMGAGLMGREFSIVSLTAIFFFGGLVALAVAYVERPDMHKRLMLLATVSILQAAAARWFFVLFAPPEARGLSPSETGPAPVAISIAPGLLVDLLIVAAMIYDWRARGHVHRVWLIGAPALVFLQFIRVPLSTTPAWHAIAAWFAGLAG